MMDFEEGKNGFRNFGGGGGGGEEEMRGISVMLKDLLRKIQKKLNSRNSNSTSTTGFSNTTLYALVYQNSAINYVYFTCHLMSVKNNIISITNVPTFESRFILYAHFIQ
jgi:hypothetical protein